jgi:GNAT superfamily N-acetyltransferase
MKLKVFKTELEKIGPLRAQFLTENNFQVRYDACHARNWSDSYLITGNGTPVGYGAVKGREDLYKRDAVFEFYLTPSARKLAPDAFVQLLRETNVPLIECQTNDLLLTSLMYEFSHKIYADYILFEDHEETAYRRPELAFRPRLETDHVFGLDPADAGQYVLDRTGEIVATGGFLLHYNFPFADLYMEVKKECRKRGYGSYILQELKKVCYESGRVPAARCRIENKASKATLIKAGMKVCGYMLTGTVRASIRK